MKRLPTWVRNTAIVVAAIVLIPAVSLFIRPVDVYIAWDRALLWLSGFEGRYIEIQGHRIHYYEGGAAGETIVLVHGLGGRATNWRPLMRGLGRDYRVLAIDLLGFGMSDKPADGDYSIAAQSDRLRDFLDQKNLRSIHLAGWSMGGWISLDFAARWPDRIDKLMLLASAGMVFEPKFDPKVLHPDNREELLEMLRILPVPIPPRFVQRDILRSMKEHAFVVERAVNSMLTGRDALDGRLKSVTMPVLLLWGKDDRLTPLSVAESMRAEMSHAKLVTLAACGHLAPVLCADRVLPVLQDFLRAGG